MSTSPELNAFIEKCRDLCLKACNGIKPTVPEVAPLVREYYDMPGNGVGGSLHIVLDDQNVDDRHVDMCIGRARECGDDAGRWLGTLLYCMSKTQRLKLSDPRTYR